MTIHSANSDTVCDIHKIARQVSSGGMSSIEKFEEALHLKNVTDINLGKEKYDAVSCWASWYYLTDLARIPI